MTNILANHIQKIINLSESEIEHVRSFFTEEYFQKKDFIIRENYKVEHVYFIISGLVKLSYYDKEGKEHIISFAMEDWWESDYMAFYTQTKATQVLQCLEKTTVLKLSYKDYHQLLKEVPKMVEFFLSKAVNGHISNQRRILSLMTLDAKERYEQFLKYYPSLIQRIPKTTLAAYLGLSRETLSRFFRES
ncbi:cAMP-binding domain of CRP or a regulatory subunit of cAMP-dependent protein kinases [Chryseobacterium arachidis]|uniref:cAMP-binding domain of CRP or a regulatory subunit of cAMP-dependent protein kinases n=2 Tax=Chryseobacterium arachidis TaxID=1416778 RepID=A0A1M5FV72_9FLAO|nr:Crp/Fnr family transcriptional regulator [Chryseobacterium arachidis]SHF95092.1 cAMP-binding domain of CRP or a regulatory subunit of cAMP-dependent protein kinases [Chryseobacterium arachidis]